MVTGPAFQGQALETIGPDAVLVPSATCKAIHDPRSGGTGAYVCSNAAAPRCGTMSVATLAGTVGIDPFPALPDGVKQTAMALPRQGEPLWSRASTPPGGPMTKLKPFADDAASISVGELTIESGLERIALYGSLDLTRDKQGLAHARALAALLDQAIQILEADPSLPDAVPPPVAPKTVKNPFE